MTATTKVLSDPDNLSGIIKTLCPIYALRSASIVSKPFRNAVKQERAMRLSLPSTTKTPYAYAYIGGGSNREDEYSAPYATARVDVVGIYATTLPSLPKTLRETSAAQLDDGRIVVLGDRAPPVLLVFVPCHWRWYDVSDCAPNIVGLGTLVPCPGGRFAAIGGYDTESNRYSSTYCVYSPAAQGGAPAYEEKVVTLGFSCCNPVALTSLAGQTTFLAFRMNNAIEMRESACRAPLVFPAAPPVFPSAVVEMIPRSARSLLEEGIHPTAAWVAIDVNGGGKLAASEVAVLVQPTWSQTRALLWVTLPHGSWRQVAYLTVEAAVASLPPNDSDPSDASKEYIFDGLNPPRLAVVVLNGERHLVAAAFLGIPGKPEHLGVWMGAPITEIVAAMSLPQSPSIEEEDEAAFEARGLVRLRNLSGMLHTPIRFESCLFPFAPY